MAQKYFKTTWAEVDGYGVPQERIVYSHENAVCDVTTFYDEDGELLFSYQDSENNNLAEAIELLIRREKLDNPMWLRLESEERDVLERKIQERQSRRCNSVDLKKVIDLIRNKMIEIEAPYKTDSNTTNWGRYNRYLETDMGGAEAQAKFNLLEELAEQIKSIR